MVFDAANRHPPGVHRYGATPGLSRAHEWTDDWRHDPPCTTLLYERVRQSGDRHLARRVYEAMTGAAGETRWPDVPKIRHGSAIIAARPRNVANAEGSDARGSARTMNSSMSM